MLVTCSRWLVLLPTGTHCITLASTTSRMHIQFDADSSKNHLLGYWRYLRISRLQQTANPLDSFLFKLCSTQPRPLDYEPHGRSINERCANKRGSHPANFQLTTAPIQTDFLLARSLLKLPWCSRVSRQVFLSQNLGMLTFVSLGRRVNLQELLG
ncbi:hypothetical protein F5B17DRAFT_232384 [Nemania serpens]|nr:hypothetical protein F5B17DRAFT_232384 [Nemania serpens]